MADLRPSTDLNTVRQRVLGLLPEGPGQETLVKRRNRAGREGSRPRTEVARLQPAHPARRRSRAQHRPIPPWLHTAGQGPLELPGAGSPAGTRSAFRYRYSPARDLELVGTPGTHGSLATPRTSFEKSENQHPVSPLPGL